MVSVDISLTPFLPGATQSLSGSPNKRILGDFMGLCFFGRLRLRQKEGVTRIYQSKREARLGTALIEVVPSESHGPCTAPRKGR